MPDLLTPQALATAGPLVVETLFKHFFDPRQRKKSGPARKDDLMYDEAFVLMRTFIETATNYPVANLQKFGMVRTPTPPWVGLHRVIIPPKSLEEAAESLIKGFGGKEMAYKIAGGSKWWQVRAGVGVEGEWIVMKKDWREATRNAKGEKVKTMVSDKEGTVGDDGGVNENGEFRREMDELRCMLYIHGGAYYWGSINTHRYTMWRHARKMHGRLFAVNYRKCPQYPFPCGVQDCLAAWMYLTRPPPGAKHTPVHPKNIVLAGDSAGGGLVLALLQILRDTEGLELPAGAILISPWSDLTHSFPSILKNTATDIVPPFGFIHKPSSLWPPPPPELTDEMQDRLRSRVKEAISRLKKNPDRDEDLEEQALDAAQGDITASPVRQPQQVPEKLRSSDPNGRFRRDGLHSQSTAENNSEAEHPLPHGEPHRNPSRANPADMLDLLVERNSKAAHQGRPTTLSQCHAALELAVDGESVAIDTQIQLYATNAQLCHPWISPVLGYLGGLPPLYICAGDEEVLRDEIIYLAHKAAHPDQHPVRDDVRKLCPALQGIESRFGPTDVHLQVYDGVCHDLPLLSMTRPARGVFRAIASFARFVTPSAPGSLSIRSAAFLTPRVSSTGDGTPSVPSDATENPFILEPTITSTPPLMTPAQSTLDLRMTGSHPVPQIDQSDFDASRSSMLSAGQDTAGPRDSARHARIESDSATAAISDKYNTPISPTQIPDDDTSNNDDTGPWFDRESPERDGKAQPGTAGYSGVYHGSNPYTDHMIRERVATHGQCRPLEAELELPAMTMPADEIGFIKEGPALRYLNGQALWDKKFSRAIRRIAKHRRKNLHNSREKDTRKIARMWQDRVRQHQEERSNDDQEKAGRMEEGDAYASGSEREKGHLLDQSWSWTWALDGEVPPASAIVSRRDFGEARQLALMADRMDDHHHSPVNGLSIWVGLAALLSTSSEKGKAHEAVKQARAVHKSATEEESSSSEGEEKGPGSKTGKEVETEGHKVKRTVRRFFGLSGKHENVEDTDDKQKG